MKAYNTPKDELHIESDTGETLVSITPEKTTIANLEGGGTRFVSIAMTDEEFASLSEKVVIKEFPIITDFSPANLDKIVILLAIGDQVQLIFRLQSVGGGIADWRAILISQSDNTVRTEAYIALYKPEVAGYITFLQMVAA